MSILATIFLILVAISLILRGITQIFVWIIKTLWKVSLFLAILPRKAIVFVTAFLKRN